MLSVIIVIVCCQLLVLLFVISYQCYCMLSVIIVIVINIFLVTDNKFVDDQVKNASKFVCSDKIIIAAGSCHCSTRLDLD